MNVGERVGDYEITAILGAGGMGKVYKVRNVLSDRVEAMKVLLPNLEGDSDLVQRFLREIKVQAALDHPNIARLHTAQVWNNQLLMLMEYVEGSSLEKLLQHGPVAVREACGYLAQVLDALAYAHERGIVHRDIKPANIMLTPQGAIKLMDFGIARMQSDRRLTQTGHTLGSLFYMSPEQIRGAPLDPRSDLYSLGITMYEMVTGRRPFEGTSDFSLMSAHLEQTPAAPVQVVPGIPSALSDIILTAIAKDPGARFPTAREFRAALDAMGAAEPPPLPGVPVQAAAPRPPTPPPAIAAPPPPPVPGASAPASHRGLYMTLGSVATVAVITAAIVAIPRFRGTNADVSPAPAAQPPPAAVEAPPVQEPAAPSVPAPSVEPPAATAAPPLSPPNAPPAAKAAAPQNPRPVQTAQPVAVQPAAAPKTSVSPAPAQAAPAPAQVARPPVSTPPAPAPAKAPAALPQAAPQAPPTSTATASPELNQLRETYNLVAIRVGAAKAGLRALEQQQRRQGLDLRGDMVETESRMDYLMKEALDSIRAGDAAGGRRNLQMAERALESLEKFLGR
jgi:serine/threonine-protein kinase